MASTFSLLILSALTLLSSPPRSAANLQATTALFRSKPAAFEAPPTTFFEVTKPIPLPKTTPCSHLILQHDFAYTYGKPPVLTDYKPPSHCPSRNFNKIVLEWTATCKGRQFDRIFGIWLAGVEILRSCTAEPRATGITWTVRKDITKYHSLLMTNQTLAVYLGNLIDNTYTGVYHVNLTFHFYPSDSGHRNPAGFQNGPADLILPISRNLPLNDGLWFEIRNSTDVKSNGFEIPRNTFRAVLEVYVSFHENDEFWFGNYPNEYISANNLTGYPGNGPFREVVINLDNNFIVGAVWPFTVIYTGGVNPLLWRPITGIGSFDLPSYDIEVTPFLGELLDGKTHWLSFSVGNALNVWYIDANLHLWLDKKSEKTEGKVLKHVDSPLSVSLVSNFTGFDGVFVTNVTRSIVSTGSVRSSRGVITTEFTQGFRYSNKMVLGNDGNLQILNQIIDLNSSVETKKMGSNSAGSRSMQQKFSLYLHSDSVDKGDGTYDSVANVSLGVNEKRERVSRVGIFKSRLRNLQNAQGHMAVKGTSVVSGLGSTQQEYHYSSNNEPCYFRNVSSSNYTVIHDEESNGCSGKLGSLAYSARGTS